MHIAAAEADQISINFEGSLGLIGRIREQIDVRRHTLYIVAREGESNLGFAHKIAL